MTPEDKMRESFDKFWKDEAAYHANHTIMNRYDCIKYGYEAAYTHNQVEVQRLRELLKETLQTGAYGVGSTLASRIDQALLGAKEGVSQNHKIPNYHLIYDVLNPKETQQQEEK